MRSSHFLSGGKCGKGRDGEQQGHRTGALTEPGTSGWTQTCDLRAEGGF